MELEYLVVGFGVAGVAGVLELASVSPAVGLIDDPADSYVLDDHYRIGPTPLNPAPLPGVEFRSLASQALSRVGVATPWTHRGFPAFIDRVEQRPDGSID